MDKSFRIKTNIGSDTVVRVNLRQDVDTFDILSLNIDAAGGYKTFSANYGVIVGRVVGNGGIGIPNAKISVFIPLSQTDEQRSDIVALYPYKSVTDLNSDGRRYNLLPATYHDNVHVAVGTFPSAQMVLDNDICLEIYEKYYKLSTVTNNSGDYMITNVPVGTQMLHMDVDISDIGYLSQKPYDLLYKGYDKSMFESSIRFKGGTNLDLLPQIYSQNDTITVYPFWGDETSDEIAITRKDFQLQYEFQPTAVFFGSSFTDQDGNYVSEQCAVSDKCGEASQLKASRGTISMMRETFTGELEEVELGSVDQIDGNGTWCIQIPMNLDYITTNEEGDIVKTKDVTKGIPTRASVRFKLYLDGDEEDASTSHPLTYFVPSNITNDETISVLDEECGIHKEVTPNTFEELIRKMTYWGNDPSIADSGFKNICMRDMLWNCVYTVKNYIPRLQILAVDEDVNTARGFNHTGIKGVNKKNASWMNPLPYNKMNLGLSYGTWSESQSIWGSMVDWYRRIESVVPSIFSWRVNNYWQNFSWLGRYFRFFGYSRPFVFNYRTYENVATEDEILGKTLEENDGIAFDFYNDWLNGSIYFPKVKFDANDNDNICSCNKGDVKNNFYLNDSCSLDYVIDNIDQEVSNLRTHYKTNRCITNLSIFGGYTEGNEDKIDGIDWNKVEEGGTGINNFNTHTSYVNLKNGFIYRNIAKNDENNITYTYAPILGESKINDNKEKIKIYPGFRTDLVLLGSIDDYNILGIPSIKNIKLPKSTSTIVPIYRAEIPFDPSKNAESAQTLTKTSAEYEDEPQEYSQEWLIGDSGTPETTEVISLRGGRAHQVNGAYWGTAEYTPNYVYEYRWYRYWGGWWSWWWVSWTAARPVLISPRVFFTDMKKTNYTERDMGMHTLLGQGLFFGRTAFSMFSNMYVTKPKSCINLSRICELSVTNEDSLAYGNYYNNWVNADTIGIITDDQITTPLGRTLFATLNSNILKVKDGDSVLPQYNMSYEPIDGFDGFLNNMVLKESSTYTHLYTILKETESTNYIHFRYGDTKKFNNKYPGENVSSTDTEANKARGRTPITDNSFYFYFGIDPSHTAIDKFNEYYA